MTTSTAGSDPVTGIPDITYQDLADAITDMLPIVEVLRAAPGGVVNDETFQIGHETGFFWKLNSFITARDLIVEQGKQQGFDAICEKVGITAVDRYRLYMNYYVQSSI